MRPEHDLRDVWHPQQSHLPGLPWDSTQTRRSNQCWAYSPTHSSTGAASYGPGPRLCRNPGARGDGISASRAPAGDVCGALTGLEFFVARPTSRLASWLPAFNNRSSIAEGQRERIDRIHRPTATRTIAPTVASMAPVVGPSASDPDASAGPL